MSKREGTLVDFLVVEGGARMMREVFPSWTDRWQAYGKLTIGPLLQHPIETLRAMFGREENSDEPRLMHDATRKVIQWGLDGDRVAPEYRETFETALLVESAYEK
jgi:hypothetical protein